MVNERPVIGILTQVSLRTKQHAAAKMQHSVAQEKEQQYGASNSMHPLSGKLADLATFVTCVCSLAHQPPKETLTLQPPMSSGSR